MIRRALTAVLAALVLGTAAAGFLVWRLERPYRGYTAPEQFVDIPPGSSPATIGARLVEAGVVSDALTWRLALLSSGSARALKAGEYRFSEPLTARAVIGKLSRGDVYLRPFTVPEGLSILEMARLWESRGFGAAAEFSRAAADDRLVRDLDPRATDLEGYLFPDTYGVPRRTSAEVLVRQMVDRFERAFDPTLRTLAASQQRSVREIVTLASLVEKETARPEERPVIAAVYLNRLAIGMGLQCDPTVIYALQRAGRYDGNLSREDLAFDSPYNTYKYAGLPPGPIAAPGRASIEAVLKPAQVDYLYFVSRNDGSHVFSRTYDEHRQKVREFQVEYFRGQRPDTSNRPANGRGGRR